MKFKWLCGMFLTTALALPASAQISIFIGTPPPPVEYEAQPPMPAQGYVWVQGYWQPVGHHYRWVHGYWQQPPYAGAYWIAPRYDHDDDGWRYREGYWGHEDHGRGHGWGHYKEHGHGHGHDD